MAQDDYYYEIQLTNKQLVFYFMAGAAGLTLARIVPDTDELPYKTTWGQKLTKGTRRRVLLVEALQLSPLGIPQYFGPDLIGLADDY